MREVTETVTGDEGGQAQVVLPVPHTALERVICDAAHAVVGVYHHVEGALVMIAGLVPGGEAKLTYTDSREDAPVVAAYAPLHEQGGVKDLQAGDEPQPETAQDTGHADRAEAASGAEDAPEGARDADTEAKTGDASSDSDDKPKPSKPKASDA